MKRLISATPLLISLFITFSTIGLYMIQFPVFEMIEQKSLDIRFKARGKETAGKVVAIVTIDEKSLDKLGRWPWPRSTMAKLIDTLTEYDVNSIGFDVVFTEPEHNPLSDAIDNIEEKMASLSISDPSLTTYLDSLKNESDNDTLLAEAIKRSERTILGYFFHPSKDGLEHLESNEKALPANMKNSAYSSINYSSEDAEGVVIAHDNFSVEANLDIFSNNATSFGHFNVSPDRDGTIRWAAMIQKYGDNYYPPLSLQLARHFMSNPPISITVGNYGVEKILLGERYIPTDEAGNLFVNFRGGPKTFPHYSIYDVLEKKIAKEKLKDKIVLVGATAIGIYDMRVTPFSGEFPGVEIHANVIDNILWNDFLYMPDWMFLVDILIILIIGIVLGLVLPKLGARLSFVFFILLFGAYAGSNYYCFAEKGILLTAFYPLFSMLATYTAITAYRYMTEERKKKEVKRAFQHYMTSSVVNEVLKDPDKLKLGGEKKVLSVLFSDIRGFTSITENMEPEELVHLLNSYFTAMTDVVFKYEGALDKYMGDAVMAIYGAPAERKDHAFSACMTALEMLTELGKLHILWEGQDLPRLDIGIGIGTGQMVVGNMGSERLFDYTVMGDTVNLGSRLEGLNKTYGTNIIVSENTFNDVKDKLVCRLLDFVKVKGKDKPEVIYELLGKDDSGGKYHDLTLKFESALVLYREMKWVEAVKVFESLLTTYPDDPPTLLYLERCKLLKGSPPPADWDRVFTMKTK